MDINATLFGQMITFAIFVWFTMQYVWPVLEKNMKARQEKISEGLMAAERGHQELKIAQKEAVKQIREARDKAAHIIELAHKQANLIVEEAKTEATQERHRIVNLGKSEVAQAERDAREKLQGEVVHLVISSTEKLLKRSLNDADQKALLELKRADKA